MTDLVRPNASAFADPQERELIAAYIEGGSGDVPTQNERDWQRWRIVPRAFADVSAVDTRAGVLGRGRAAPIVVAPTLGHLLVHDEGEAAAAAGARLADVEFALAQGAGVPLESIGGTFLQQLYLTAERDALAPFVDRAVAAGARALLLTVDQPAAGGDPFRGDAGAVLARAQSPNFPDAPHQALGISRHVTPDDVAWLVQRWGLPVLVKGILDPESAEAAIDAGAAGVVVSNHGGRQLRDSISAPFVLPAIRSAVGSRGLVWADSGIRTGTDVFRALALGADAVLVGRPVLRALSTGGAQGVGEYLASLTEDLRVTMANAGTSRISDIGSARVRETGGGSAARRR